MTKTDPPMATGSRLRNAALKPPSPSPQTFSACCVVPSVKTAELQTVALDPKPINFAPPPALTRSAGSSKLRGYLLLGSAVLLCPCHLPILLALLAGGVGGSAVAGFLSHHLTTVIAFTAVYFVFALWLGQRLLSRRDTPPQRSTPERSMR